MSGRMLLHDTSDTGGDCFVSFGPGLARPSDSASSVVSTKSMYRNWLLPRIEKNWNERNASIV